MTTDTLVRFPANLIRSHEEFLRWSKDSRDILDERYRREQALATHDAEVVTEGMCGVCMDVASFRSSTAGGEATTDGRTVPNWREGQVCDCHRALSARQRALLHCLLAGLVAPGWCAGAAIGPNDSAADVLRGILSDLQVWPAFRIGRGTARLPGADASLQLAVSLDYLDRVGPLDRALEEVGRVLVPGGSFVFSTPFYYDRATTQTGLAQRHQFGWDVLDRLLRAGFVDAAACCYWSEELGYLGPFNMIFKAVR